MDAGPSWDGDDLFSPPPLPAQTIRRESASPEHGARLALRPQELQENVHTAAHPRAPGGQREASTFTAPQQINDVYHRPPPPHWNMGPAQAQPSDMFSQAVGQDPSWPQRFNTLGLSVVAVGAGAAIGGAVSKGVAGAGAGALFGGAAVNAYRAVAAYRQGTPQADKEGRISLLFGVLAAAGGGYLWYQFVHKRRRPMKANPEEVDDDLDLGGSCDIRPAGP